MPLNYIQKYFTQIHIIYKLFDSNIKKLTISQDIINIPQVFNLYIPNDSKVSFSLNFRNSASDSEMSEYDYYDSSVGEVVCASTTSTNFTL